MSEDCEKQSRDRNRDNRVGREHLHVGGENGPALGILHLGRLCCGPARDEQRPTGGECTLERVEREDGVARFLAEHAFHVGRTGALAAVVEDVDPVRARHEPAEGKGAQQVSNDSGDGERDQHGE